MDPLAPPALRLLCRAELDVGEMRRVDAPSGRQLIGQITTSRWTGQRFEAVQVGGGADWMYYHEDDLAAPHVQLALETVDSATVLVRYTGRSDRRTDQITNVMLFETGDDRYAWMNRVLTLARGRFDATTSTVHYDVYEVA